MWMAQQAELLSTCRGWRKEYAKPGSQRLERKRQVRRREKDKIQSPRDFRNEATGGRRGEVPYNIPLLCIHVKTGNVLYLRHLISLLQNNLGKRQISYIMASEVIILLHVIKR
jgi:hypothetical protein